MRHALNSDKIKVIGVISILMCICVAVYLGFGKDIAKVTGCIAEVKKYVTAEYSEVSTYLDSEGVMQVETDYWSEAASDVHKTTTVNGDLYTSSTGNNVTLVGVNYYPPMPQHDTGLSRGAGFDRFKKHTDTKLTISNEGLGKHDSFVEGIGSSAKCLSKLNKFITINTWYGISYSSDFGGE